MTASSPTSTRNLKTGRHLLALALILLAVLAAYLPPLRGGKTYHSMDTTDLNYVMHRSHVNDLRQHGFTAWTPAIGAGLYRAADPTYSLYSPRVLLYLLIGDYDAQLAVILIYAFLAGTSAYLLGLVLTGSFAPSLYLGLCWPLAGVMASRVSNLPYLTSAAWYPLILASWLGIGPLRARVIAAGVALAMVAVDGDLIGSGISLAVIALISLGTRPSGFYFKEGLALAGAGLIMAGLTAVIWMPAREALPESCRSTGLGIEEVLTFSLHPYRLANLLAPRLFGQTFDHSFWASFVSNSLVPGGLWFETIYLGLLAPLLWVPALARSHGRRRLAAAFMIVAALFTLLAWGRYLPGLTWLVEHAPPLRLFRYPAKLFTWSSLLLLAAAAMGLKHAATWLSGSPTGRVMTASGLFYLAAGAGFAWYGSSAADFIQGHGDDPALSFLHLRQDLIRLFGFALLVPAMIAIWSRRGKSRRLLGGAVVAVTLVDLLTALPVFPVNPRENFFEPSPIAAAIVKRGPGRVYVDNRMFQHLQVSYRTALRENWGILDGIEYGQGMTAALPCRVHRLKDLDALADKGSRVFDLLGLRYALTTLEPDFAWSAKLKEDGVIKPFIRLPKSNLVLMESVHPHPVYFLTRSVIAADFRDRAFDEALADAGPGPRPVRVPVNEAIDDGRLVTPPEPAPVSGELTDRDRILGVWRPSGDEERITVELTAPAWLVTREYLMAGWKAEVDGRSASVYFADGIGRAVLLGAGAHEVRFRFDPFGLKAGRLITAATALAILGLFIFGRRKEGTDDDEKAG